jgi:hypothetical protein
MNDYFFVVVVTLVLDARVFISEKGAVSRKTWWGGRLDRSPWKE